MNSAVRALQAIFAAGFLPCAAELADEFTLAAAAKRTGSKRLLGCKAHLIVELDGQENSVRHEIATVEKIVRQQKPLFVERGFGNEQCEAIWQIRREFSYALRDTGLTKLNEDIVVPRGKLEELFKFAATLQKKHGLQLACFGHAGDGNIHTNVMVDYNLPGAKARAEKCLDELVPLGDCVRRRDHGRTRHRPRQKTLVAAGGFRRIANHAPHHQNRARPARHFKSGEICLAGKDFLRRSADGFRQFLRLQNLRVTAPAQDPALHFGQAGQLHFQFRAAVLQVAQCLRRMPFFFADVIGGARR